MEQPKIIISEKVRNILEDRHISTIEIEAVISNATATNKKLYQLESNKFLAKLEMAGITFYVEYLTNEQGIYEVLSAYAIRSTIVG